MNESELTALIAGSAEGYFFPTDLDRDPLKVGPAPETPQAMFARPLAEGINDQLFANYLDQSSENLSA